MNRVQATHLRDGDLIRWLGGVALVRVTDTAEREPRRIVFARPVGYDDGLHHYSNCLLRWDDLSTPVYQVPRQDELEVQVLVASSRECRGETAR